jgi:hypothetical protein
MKSLLQKFHLYLMLFVMSSPLQFSYAAEWQPFMKITSNYFEGLADNHRIVITLEQEFHDCGWNTAANINLSEVGPEAFETYTAVILAAIMANRPVSLSTEGCHSNRAKAMGIRVGN